MLRAFLGIRRMVVGTSSVRSAVRTAVVATTICGRPTSCSEAWVSLLCLCGLDEDGWFFPAGFGKKTHAGLVERRALWDRLLRYQKQLGFIPVSRQQVEAPIEDTESVSRRVKAS
jgi:hypothetical protein